MNMRLLDGRILIRPTVRPTTTESGLLHIPETHARPIPSTGTIVLMSHQSPDVTVGDIVAFSNTVGQLITIRDDDLLLIPESEILAVFEPSNKE